MAPRAYWKGYLRLSLVTCPIELFPATSQSEKTHFHQINTQSGYRLRQQIMDDETGKVVDKEHEGRGYELSKGRYVEIEEDELQAVEIESTHTVDIDSFVPLAEIDKRYLDKPYYIVPDGKMAAEAFTVIRDAMKDKERVGLARIVMANREHISPWSRSARGFWARRCATITRCATKRTFSQRCPTPACRRKCSNLPSIFWKRKLGISIQKAQG